MDNKSPLVEEQVENPEGNVIENVTGSESSNTCLKSDVVCNSNNKELSSLSNQGDKLESEIDMVSMADDDSLVSCESSVKDDETSTIPSSSAIASSKKEIDETEAVMIDNESSSCKDFIVDDEESQIMNSKREETDNSHHNSSDCKALALTESDNVTAIYKSPGESPGVKTSLIFSKQGKFGMRKSIGNMDSEIDLTADTSISQSSVGSKDSEIDLASVTSASHFSFGDKDSEIDLVSMASISQSSVGNKDSEIDRISVTDTDSLISSESAARDVEASAVSSSSTIASPKQEIIETEGVGTDHDVSSHKDSKESHNISSKGEETDNSNHNSSDNGSKKASTAAESNNTTLVHNSAEGSSDAQTPTKSSRQGSFGMRKSRQKTQISELTPDALKEFQLPFKHGWRREVVRRNVVDVGKRTQCDIYYFAPSGKKLRSMVEIDDWLKTNSGGPVKYKHFSFSRMPISEPPNEIVRDAGNRKPKINITPETKEKLKEKKALKTGPQIPARRQTGPKLSSILPRSLAVSKSTPHPPIIRPSVTPSPTQTPFLLGKRPLIKRTKMTGHTFFKKQRLSPEWKPDDDDSSFASNGRAVSPKRNPESEEEAFQRIMGTPSKLISSIVNPQPPKQVKQVSIMPQLSTANRSLLPQPGPVPADFKKIHVVNPAEILAGLGLNPKNKNIRMVNAATGLPFVNASSIPPDSKIIIVPVNSRLPKPFETVTSSVGYQANNSAKSFTPVQPLGPVSSFLSSIGQTVSVLSPPQTTDSRQTVPGQPSTIPPPPPLAVRPLFTGTPVSMSGPMQSLLTPPRLIMASAPNILPKPPPLKDPFIRANMQQVTEQRITTEITSFPAAVTSSSTLDYPFLRTHLTNKNDTPTVTTVSNSTKPVQQPVAPITINGPLKTASFPHLSSSSSLDNNIPTVIYDRNFPDRSRKVCSDAATIGNKQIDSVDKNKQLLWDFDSRNLPSQAKTNPSGTLDKKDNDIERIEEAQDSLLPISFGPLHSSLKGLEKEQSSAISKSVSYQEVDISVPLSHMDMHCPTTPRPGSDSGILNMPPLCALEDHDHVVLKLPSSHFSRVDKDLDLILKLNGHEICVAPSSISEEEQDVVCKIPVQELKRWAAEQSLNIKISACEKRRITFSKHGKISAYLRSFFVPLQENYNIMMSIFKHLSIHDRLRACRVCKIWRRMVLQKCLWRKLNLQGLTNIKWIPAVNFFMNVDARTLIMPEPLLSRTDGPETVDIIIDALSRMTQLKELCFGTVPQSLIDSVLENMPHVKSVGAEFIVNSEPEIYSTMISNTSSTEITMSHAVELVLSRGFSTTDAASMTGVKEADLSHLTQGKPADLTKDEGDSVVLCCMRLCQMGFTIDISVIEARFQEAMKKRLSHVKLSPHALGLVCQKLLRKNHHLLQSKLPYQPQDSGAKKLKAFYSDLQRLYEDVNLKDSTSVLAFSMKEFRVLNAAGNKMQRVTALSVISPANLNLPIMVIFPVPVTYKDSYPGQILITSKDGVPSSNLVTHYLRAVFDQISVRPLLIFFDGHENLLSLEFVSECINKSIILRCVPRDISDIVFPGKHGGILHTVSKIVGSELMGEKTFLDNISFHIWEDWWATWQGMCKAFQISGIFPLKMSAITNSQQSTIPDSGDPNEEQSEENVDEDSSQIVVSSDEDSSDEESETSKSNDKWDLPENEGLQTENQKAELKGQSHNLNTEESLLNTPAPHSNFNLNEADTKSATPSTVENELKRKTGNVDRDVIQVDTSSEDLSSSDESVACTEDSARSKKLFIHIDDDEKENQDTIVSPPHKKIKVSHTESYRTVASSDSLSETIDSVIAESRAYYDALKLSEESVSFQQPGNKDRKGKKSTFISGLKLKLSTKKIVNSVNDEDENYKDSFIKSNEDNLKEIIGRNNNECNEDKSDRLKVIEVEDMEEDGEDETKSDEEVNDVEIEMSDRNEIGYKPERTEKETSGDESDLEVSQHSDNSSGIDDKKETCKESQPRRQKKKKKKKNKNRGKDNEVLAESQENTNEKERSSKRKKRKKRKKKEKRSKTREDDEIFSEKEHNEKESTIVTDTSLEIKDTGVEEKDTSLAKTDSSLETQDSENSMLAMKTISLADHDYDAKFDSDSGHELVEETACEVEKEDTETLKVLMENNNQGEDDKQLENTATLSNQNEDDKKETSDSSSDSDSSQQSGSRSSNSSSSSSSSSSSNSSSNSSGDDSSDSNEDEGETSNQPAVVVSDSQSDQSSEEKDEENGSGDSDSQADQAKKESSSNSSEENQSASDDEASSKEQMYSDAEEDEESGDDDDDDSKCQLCMASNPPHSNVKVIDWVDCDNNCGRWFHVVCIHRSKSKIDPKHFVCPSCRCIR